MNFASNNDEGSLKEKEHFPQEPLWDVTLNAIRESQSVDILTNAKALANILHFNSDETRSRYGRAMATRFARIDLKWSNPQILSGFFNIAKAGLENKIISSIWRILFCSIEPIIARTYLEIIWPREPGSQIQRSEIRNYVEMTFHQQSKKLNTRIINCLHQAGFASPQGKEALNIIGFGDLDASLFLATHLLFAQDPKTIKISEIMDSSFWKYLGYYKFDYVRIALRGAESKGLILRYAVVDHLEQITTRYSLADLISHWRELYENERI